MSVYITSVSGGNCATKSNNSIVNKRPSKDNAQLWTIERKDGAENHVAFRCNADGQYLRAQTGNSYGPMETGAKQWWQLEDGPAHGSYWLKCLDFPNAYLCNANGSYVENNKIYMWPRQLNWTHALTFYLQDANAPGYLAQGEQKDGASSNEEAKKLLEDVKKREEALAEKEAEAAKAAKLSEEAKKLMEEAKKKEAAIAEKEKQLGKGGGKVSDEDAKRLKDLDEKEKQLAEREKALDARDKARGGASGGNDADAKARKQEEEALSKERKEVAKKFAELEAREKEVAAKEKQVAQNQKNNGGEGAAASDDSGLVEENKRLAEELAQAKRELANLSKGGLGNRTGGRGVPPPSIVLPERRRPDTTRPAQKIPSTYNPELLKRFEAGRTAMKA